ncbi:hypothetical protein BCR22_04730 [Enterococcus plantarum]|uniref:Uncharacterized protein n=1 Tax=Enterococcus plantarum TaxID=1077675 RepID=A0A2W3Z7Z6_9ENTE|nr:hypothetical protein [Enterococcus plantarum]MBO0468242.1 hypothetical protein [Enterococcus plantarum]OEG12684.1 hypothetical protein BCR22_04730 [Enterococcus plantarum]PZL73410.1 hypothetical protein CI088_08755 [Enterococcus plantarum]
MTFNPQIETLILEASYRKSPHFVANVINFQQYNQEDVKDTAQKLIEDGQIHATIHFYHNDLCTIDFIPQAI